jgi:hypothetical protein
VIPQLTIAGALVLAIGAVGFRLGYLEAEDDHIAEAQTQRMRVDKANYDAALAAFRYAEWRDRHYLEMQDAIAAVSRVAKSHRDWADTHLPAGVRDAARRAARADTHSGKPATSMPGIQRPRS